MKSKLNTSPNWVRDQPLSFWVRNDARSAHAWLCHKGDGRVEIYLLFVWMQAIFHRSRDLEEINGAFHVYCSRRGNAALRLFSRFYGCSLLERRGAHHY